MRKTNKKKLDQDRQCRADSLVSGHPNKNKRKLYKWSHRISSKSAYV